MQEQHRESRLFGAQHRACGAAELAACYGLRRGVLLLAQTRTKKSARKKLEVDDRREAIIDAALELFERSEHGDITTEQIAHAARISKALIFHYFPTKNELWAAAVRKASREMIEMSAPDESLPPGERLYKSLDGYVGFVDKRGRAYIALLTGGLGGGAEVMGVIQDNRKVFADRVCKGVGVKRPTPLLLTALNGWCLFCEGAALHWFKTHEIGRGELVKLCIDTLVAILQVTRPNISSSP